MSFSVDLNQDCTADSDPTAGRQDFSLQNATTLPINDSPAFLAIMKLLTASSPAAGLWSLSFRDKLRVLRTLVLAQLQARQTIKPYQQLRYWSTVPFRHGPVDVVKHSATPSPDNPAAPLQRGNPNGLQDELIRHLKEDGKMSAFDFGLQFLDAEQDDLLGQAAGRRILDRKCKCGVERSGSTFPHGRAAYPPIEVRTSAGRRRCNLYRCHWKLDT